MATDQDGNRVEFRKNGTLDEVFGSRFGHLEHMGGNRWFLEIGHADGTSSAFWFSSKDLKKPFWETRQPGRFKPVDSGEKPS